MLSKNRKLCNTLLLFKADSFNQCVFMNRIMHTIMLNPVMETAGTNQFENPYRLIPFGSRVRTERPFEQMRLMGMARSSGLATLSCARTQLVLIKML